MALKSLWQGEHRYAVVVCGAVMAVATIFALLAIGYGLFSNQLVAGPGVVISAPSVDDSARGLTTITPTELDSSWLRISWNGASALILLAITRLAFAGVGVARSLDPSPLFSQATTERVTRAIVDACVLIAIGGIARWALAGSIGDRSGLTPIDYSDDDFSLFIFDIPFLALFGLILGFGWLWSRGAQLQTDAERPSDG